MCQKSTSYLLRDELPEDDSFELLLLLFVLTLPLLLRLGLLLRLTDPLLLLRLLPLLLRLTDPLLLLLGLEVLAAGADCLEGAEDWVLAAGADCLDGAEDWVLAAGADLLTDPSVALLWVVEVWVWVLCAGAEPVLVLLLTVEPDLVEFCVLCPATGAVVLLLVATVPADLRSVPLLCAADDWPLEVEADLLPSVLTEAVPLELLLRLDWTLAPIASPSLL